LSREFYERETLIVGRELLGKILIRTISSKRLVARIVDVECYKDRSDLGSYVLLKPHIAEPMFGHGGYSFVTVVHGHNLLNITTEKAGTAGAVLIRGIEPVNWKSEKKTDGPAKVAKALVITRSLSGIDLTSSDQLSIFFPNSPYHFEVVASTRVHVKSKEPWRFYIKDNRYASEARALNNGNLTCKTR
jgi:DNA-3-methyladenine glycosylase